MPLVDQPFADTFTFSRARAAAYVDETGAAAEAAIDVPRFDHAGDGTPLGLLIEGRPQYSAADRLAVISGDWAQAQGTVLHQYLDDAGTEQRRAWYAPNDPVGTVNGCLNLKGRHQRLAYVQTYLPNRGGFVRWGGQDYVLGAIIAVSPGVALGETANIMLLEG